MTCGGWQIRAAEPRRGGRSQRPRAPVPQRPAARMATTWCPQPLSPQPTTATTATAAPNRTVAAPATHTRSRPHASVVHQPRVCLTRWSRRQPARRPCATTRVLQPAEASRHRRRHQRWLAPPPSGLTHIRKAATVHRLPCHMGRSLMATAGRQLLPGRHCHSC